MQTRDTKFKETEGDFEEESHPRNNLSSQAGQPVETAWLPSGCGSMWLLLWRGKLLTILDVESFNPDFAPPGPTEERPELGATNQCKPRPRKGEEEGSLWKRRREAEEEEAKENWKELKASAHDWLAYLWCKWISGDKKRHPIIEDH